MKLNEQNLRQLIRTILREQKDQEASDPGFDIAPGYPIRFQNEPASKKAKILLSTLQDLGVPVEKVISAGSAEIRLGLKKESDPVDLESTVELAFQNILDGEDIEVTVIPPDVSPNLSGIYNAYYVEGQPLIVFGGAGLSTGSRKKGYEYEEDMEAAFKDAGIPVDSDNDTSTTDIEVGGIGIELKLPTAQAGEPMLMYNFKTQEFEPTSPKPANYDIAKVINTTLSKDKTKRKFDIVKKAIKLDANTLARVSKDVFFNVIKPALKDEPNETMSTYEITPADLRKYYKDKGADLIQVKGKGLFHLTDSDAVSFNDGRSTPLFDMDNNALGNITFRNAKTYYGIRPGLKNDPLKKIRTSKISLDNPEDRKLFAQWAEKKNLNESTQNRWKLIAGLK